MNYRCIGRDNFKWDIFDYFQPVCKFIVSDYVLHKELKENI